MIDRDSVWVIWGTRFPSHNKELYAVVTSEDEAVAAVAYLEEGKDTSEETYSFDAIPVGLPPAHQATSIRYFKRDDEELYYLVDPITKEWWRYYLTSEQATAFAAKKDDQVLVRADTLEEALATLPGERD